MKFQLNNEEVTFNIYLQVLKNESDLKSVFVERGLQCLLKRDWVLMDLTTIMVNFDGDGIKDYKELNVALIGLDSLPNQKYWSQI